VRTIQGTPGQEFNLLALSPDGTRLLAAAVILGKEGPQRSELVLWDATTGKLLTTVMRGEPVQDAGFSPDGKKVYAVWGGEGRPRQSGNAVTFWDTTGKQMKVYKAKNAGIGHVAYGVDGVCRAVQIDDDRPIGERWNVWNLSADRVRVLDCTEWRGVFLHLTVLHPDGRRLATQLLDEKTGQMIVKLWERGRGEKVLFTYPAPSEHGSLERPQFAPSGKQLLVLEQHVPLLANLAGTAPTRLVGHMGRVTHAAFRADGRRLATPSVDGTVKIWDTDAPPEPFTAELQPSGEVMDVAFSPDSKRVAAAGTTYYPFKIEGGVEDVLEIRVWEMATGKRLLSLTRPKQTGQAVAFSPDGKRLFSASMVAIHDAEGKKQYRGEVVIWHADKGTPGLTLRGHANLIFGVAFSPDGQLLATAGANYDRDRKQYGPGEVKLWDAESGREVRALQGHGSMVWRVVFSRNGKRLATASLDSTVRVWETDTGKEILVFRGHRHSVYDVAFSPDGELLASVGGDPKNRDKPGEAFLWNAATGEQQLALAGHMGLVGRVAFSPDGKRLATASGYWNVTSRTYNGNEIKIWDVATGQELMNLRGGPISRGSAQIQGLAFSPDGSRLAYCSSATVTVLTAPAPENDLAKGRQKGH
jgi:WD40 repeat protein